MRKYLILMSILGAGLLVSCSREPVESASDEDVQFAVQAEEEDAIALANSVEDPGSPVLNRYGGFFVWGHPSRRDTMEFGCITLAGDTTDSDGDRVFTNMTITFDNCTGVDTIIRPFDTLTVEYRIDGQITHNDEDDSNPYVFSSGWGSPFEQEVTISKSGVEIFRRLLVTSGGIQAEQTGATTMHLNHNATFFAVNIFEGKTRQLHVEKSVDVDFSRASQWHPGLELTDADTLTISFQGTGYFENPDHIRFDVEVRTDPSIIVTGACRRQDGSLGILEGRIVKRITSRRWEKTVIINFHNCQATIED